MKTTKAPPKNLRERTARLLKMAGSMASKELVKRLSKNQEGGLINLAQAKVLVAELGNLKGAAMKLGQMLALEGRDFLPEEVCVLLDQLQSNVSFMDYRVMNQVLHSELGEKATHFRDFSNAPIAAASIGQVHSAYLPDQGRVAIKIQYPHVFESIHSDVKILSGLLKTLALMTGKDVDFSDLINEFTEILVQESDYIKEAYFTELYREKASLVSTLDVPRVFKDYSTQRVLTTEFKSGLKISEWMDSRYCTLENREYFGHLVLDLYVREFCEWGLVQTDPNLGNFLIEPKQRTLILLDFGATKSYSYEFRKKYSQLVQAILEKDDRKVIQLGQEMNLIDPRESKEAVDCFKNLIFQSMHPILADSFDFSDTTYPETMRNLGRELVKKLKYSPPPKDLIFLHRKLSGVFFILRRLGVRLKLRGFLERFENLAAQ